MLKKELEFGINELNKEPASINKVLDKLMNAIERADKEEVFKRVNELDIYACKYLTKEEYYADISNFPKMKLLKKDHDYYRATYYRLRYHLFYYDIEVRKYKNIYTFALHLASNLKEWLDFHKNTLDEELIEHMKNMLKDKDN